MAATSVPSSFSIGPAKTKVVFGPQHESRTAQREFSMNRFPSGLHDCALENLKCLLIKTHRSWNIGDVVLFLDVNASGSLTVGPANPKQLNPSWRSYCGLLFQFCNKMRTL